MANDIQDWLNNLGFGEYVDAFVDNAIDWKLLTHLTNEDLKDLGVDRLGDRKRLLLAIAQLDGEADEATSAVAADKPSPRPRFEAERRQLTVLFCDLVGSTPLSQQLDPEDYREVMRRYQDAVAGSVTRFGGHIAKYLGDGVLAYFGWPQAYEDQARRAILSGLAVLKAVSSLKLENGAALGARVGVATGRVVIGDLVDEAGAISGATPNLAARIQEKAKTGQLLVSDSTRHIIGDAFELDEVGSMNLKGFRDAANIWCVVKERPAETRFDQAHGGALTAFIGRQQEIDLIYERWEQASRGEGQFVLLSGEAGIGKSRICQVLRDRIADQPHLRLRYQCSPYHSNSALHPFITQLERAAGFAATDPSNVKLDKIEALLSQGVDDVYEWAPPVAELLSVPVGDRYPIIVQSPQQKKERTIQALSSQLMGLSQKQPVLLVFEDAHWADPTSLEALELAITQTQQARVLLLVTHRPEFAPPWHGYSNVTALTLNRLSREHSVVIANNVTGGKALPHEVIEQIAARTDGVPLFVEELTKTVIESGLLRETPDSYELAGPLPPLAIPSTLHDSLMARLDRLAPVKEVAQLASVIGREFSLALLATVSPLSDNELQSALGQLLEAELIYRQGAGPKTRYFFKHALVQDVAYQSILKTKRKRLHTEIANNLEEELPDIPAVEPEVLAYHFSEAGVHEKAVLYWQLASDRAVKSTAYAETIGHCLRGLESLKSLPENSENAKQELSLQMTLGPALMNVRGQGAPEVEQAYARARDLCRSIDDAQTVFPVLFGLWYSHLVRAELAVAHELANELLTLAKRSGDRALLLAAHRALGQNLCFMGKLIEARNHLDHALSLYEPDKDSKLSVHYGQDLAVICCAWQGLALWLLGHPDQALCKSQDAIIRARALAHPYSEAYALNWACMLHLFRRDLAAGRECAGALLALAEDHAYAMYVASGDFWLAYVDALRTDPTNRSGGGALERLGAGLTCWQATGAGVFRPHYLAMIGEVGIRFGESDNAITATSDGLTIVEQTGERYYEPELQRLKGELLKGKNIDEASIAFKRAIDIAQRQNAKSLELRAAISLARLLQEIGDRQQARELLEPILNWFDEGFDTPDLRDANVLLDELKHVAFNMPRSRHP